jgi:hypothetical protein
VEAKGLWGDRGLTILRFAFVWVTNLPKLNCRWQFWLLDWQSEVSWLNFFGALFHNKWLAGWRSFEMSQCL